MKNINGKPLKTVLNEIQVPAPELKCRKQDKNYYPIEAYESRLNDVVGMENYTAEYSAVQCIPLPSGQVILCCNCTLLFFDEERSVVHKAHGIGTSEQILSEDKKRFYGLNNAGYICQLAAFKSACKSLNIFGMHGDEEAEERKSSHSSKPDRETGEKPQEVKQVFYTEGSFFVLRTDTRTNKPVYKVLAHLKVGNSVKKDACEVIFYPNQYADCTDKLNQLQALCSDGKMHCISIRCTRATYESDVPQYIFKGFYKEA